jgi:putative membrane protein
MAMAAGGLVVTLTTGQLSPLQAQEGATVEADADIVREVNARNLFEIRLGEITRKRSTNPSVRDFGDRMMTEHSSMHQQWSGLVGKDGKPFRTGLGDQPALNAEVRRLEKVEANQFDREYMASMIRQHQDNVQFFQNSVTSARSFQVRDLLTSGLPVVQQHLNLATQVGSQVGVGAGVAVGNPSVPSNVPVATPTPPAGQNPVVTGQAPVVTQKDRSDIKKDRRFIQNALADNMLEIRLAQFAQKQTTNGDVRRLATHMLSDHTAMQRQWIDLTARHGMPMSPGMGRRHRDKVKRLERTPAAEFDRAYTTMLIQNNQDYIEYFQKEGAATKSAQVRSQAANDLLSLRAHVAGSKKIGLLVGVDTTAALRARNLSSYRK